MSKSILLCLLILAAAITAAAQASKTDEADEKCTGRVYQPNEVSKRPKYGEREIPGLTREAVAHRISGRVLLTAVLCRTGKVTDIKVVEGLPYGVTEKAIDAARSIHFQPAEIDGLQVSETVEFDYYFGYIGERRPPAKEPIEGRVIETVELTVTKDKSLEEMWKLLKTRSGEPYKADLVAADLRALLAMDFLDPKKTSVRVEEGVRGGVNVIFELYGKTR